MLNAGRFPIVSHLAGAVGTRNRPAPTPFDRIVLAVVVALVAAIAIAMVRGDRVGVRIGRLLPNGDARSTSTIVVQFSEDMDRASAQAHLQIDPPVAGDVTWSGRTMTFHPSEPLQTGARYTVTVEPGARSEAGRELLAAQTQLFTVAGERIAYLAPIDAATKNIWIASAADPSSARQLTTSRSGILSFDVSADGGRVVYSEQNDTKGADLKMLDMDTGEVRQLTTCGNGLCMDPVWSPDGSQIAFSRQASAASPIPGVPRDDTRVWLLDPSTTPAKAQPLFTDPQVRAHYNPRWSPDGSWIAVSQPTGVSNGSAGVLLYHFADGRTEFYSTTGPAGAFSSDSTSFSFPALAVQDSDVQPVVEQADLETGQTQVISAVGSRVTPVQIDAASDAFTIAQRSADSAAGLGQQLYAMNAESGLLDPLLVEPNYDHQTFAWDSSGRYVVMERTLVKATDPSQGTDVRSQVWTLDAKTGQLTQIAADAYRPHWIP